MTGDTRYIDTLLAEEIRYFIMLIQFQEGMYRVAVICHKEQSEHACLGTRPHDIFATC